MHGLLTQGCAQLLSIAQGRGRAQELEQAQAGMGDHVHDHPVPQVEAHAHQHQADLRHGGVGERVLGVALRAPAQRGVDSRECARGHDGDGRGGRSLEQGRGAEQQVHARVDGECTVKERAAGRRPFHRARQPAAQRKLRGLADGGQ